MLGSWDAEDLGTELLGEVSEGTGKHPRDSELILRSESKFRGKPLLTQTPAIRAGAQQVSALYLRKLGLRGVRKCVLGTGRAVTVEEFRVKHLGWAQKASAGVSWPAFEQKQRRATALAREPHRADRQGLNKRLVHKRW